MYGNGKGVPQDDTQAVVWYIKAAQQGNASAQFSLGVMYEQGRGVPQDDTKAVVWYIKAAQQGHVSAQYNLGLMYAKGQGVPQNYKIAYILFNMAASKGNDNAVKARDMALSELTPAARADAQRISTRLYNAKDFAADLRKLLNGQK
jgi:TPR repeat protein